MTANDEEPIARVEAALYSAGRPLTVEEIKKAARLKSNEDALSMTDELAKKVKNTFKALELVRLPDGSYVFQMKPSFNNVIKKYASKPVLSTAVLKTLSYIAYMQPISSRQLSEIRGSGVYSHLRHLRELDLIKYQNVGRNRVYNTTEKFQRFFGIPGNDKELLKQKLFSKVRIPKNVSQKLQEVGGTSTSVSS